MAIFVTPTRNPTCQSNYITNAHRPRCTSSSDTAIFQVNLACRCSLPV